MSSHEHVILQCLDIALDAVQFRLNDKHLEKLPDSRIRTKRTLAKEYVYKAINKSIRSIHPNFNIGITTGTGGNVENCWNHSYRHWLFKAHHSSIDLSKTKRAITSAFAIHNGGLNVPDLIWGAAHFPANLIEYALKSAPSL